MLITEKLKRLYRTIFPPVGQVVARKWERRLNILYIFFAWNALGAVIYFTFTDRADWAKYYGLKTETSDNPAERYGSLVKTKNPTIIQMKGFKDVQVYRKEDSESQKEESTK